MENNAAALADRLRNRAATLVAEQVAQAKAVRDNAADVVMGVIPAGPDRCVRVAYHPRSDRDGEFDLDIRAWARGTRGDMIPLSGVGIGLALIQVAPLALALADALDHLEVVAGRLRVTR